MKRVEKLMMKLVSHAPVDAAVDQVEYVYITDRDCYHGNTVILIATFMCLSSTVSVHSLICFSLLLSLLN